MSIASEISSGRRFRRASIIGVVILGCIFATVGLGVGGTLYTVAEHQTPENLSFQFRRCDEAQAPGTDRPISQFWVNRDTLRIDTVFYPNCSTRWVLGDYSQRGEKLYLRYQRVEMWAMDCRCAYEGTYEISGLRKRDYEIIVKEGPEVDVSLGSMFGALFGRNANASY